MPRVKTGTYTSATARKPTISEHATMIATSATFVKSTLAISLSPVARLRGR